MRRSGEPGTKLPSKPSLSLRNAFWVTFSVKWQEKEKNKTAIGSKSSGITSRSLSGGEAFAYGQTTARGCIDPRWRGYPYSSLAAEKFFSKNKFDKSFFPPIHFSSFSYSSVSRGGVSLVFWMRLPWKLLLICFPKEFLVPPGLTAAVQRVVVWSTNNFPGLQCFSKELFFLTSPIMWKNVVVQRFSPFLLIYKDVRWRELEFPNMLIRKSIKLGPLLLLQCFYSAGWKLPVLKEHTSVSLN